jgi:hypothetical protein|tara:strand:- start:2752 stop:3315 length:564 start_codon:yes stop_codon:yes gene_type:complete
MGIGTDEVAPQASVSDEQRYDNYINSRMGDAGFLAELAKRSPEEQEIFKRQLYRSYADESALATDELMMAEELRGKQSQQGFKQGDVFVANVGGGIGDMMDTYRAGSMRRDAKSDLEEQAASKEAGRMGVATLQQDAYNTVAGANQKLIDQNTITVQEQEAIALRRKYDQEQAEAEAEAEAMYGKAT